MIASGDWTCTIADWTGRMIGPWKGLDGKVHQATNKRFALEFCTVPRWKNGEIVEEKLVYDLVSFLPQLGGLNRRYAAVPERPDHHNCPRSRRGPGGRELAPPPRPRLPPHR